MPYLCTVCVQKSAVFILTAKPWAVAMASTKYDSPFNSNIIFGLSVFEALEALEYSLGIDVVFALVVKRIPYLSKEGID